MSENEGQIKVVCPNCSTKQFVDADRAFTKTFCDNCSVRFTIPKLFGTILLHDIISNDEFSTTFSATHLEQSHQCHVRVFDDKVSKNETLIETLKKQIYKIKELAVPGIRKILSYGFIGEEFFIETETVDNGSLKTKLATGKVSQRAALQYSISLLEALKEAESTKLVLGNIKPSTIRCLPDRKVSLDDCGVTNLVTEQLRGKSKEIDRINNHHYCAPEMAEKKEATHKSDLYAAGCVMYELICKIPPFEDFKTKETILKAHQDTDPISITNRKPSIPKDVNDQIMAILSKDPEQRPSDFKKIIDCFGVNLQYVEEVKVDEIKQEFNAPDPSQTLKPRPPTEIDLNILAGVAEDPKSISNVNADTLIASQKKVMDSTNIDLLLDPNITDVEPDIKLQDTAVNMQDFDDLEAAYAAGKNFKMMIIAIFIFVIIVGGGLLFVFYGSNPSPEREQLPNSTTVPANNPSELKTRN
ncbi:MAG: protein kinase [Lentisphaeraceae bacterium]|nr:protein kinase [Lentisphaeraceae bacterium]